MGWKRCDPRARARCPDRKTCELDAVFSEGSECDAFNYRCTEQPPTIADHIRAMTDEELAGYLAKMLADYTTGLYDGSYVPSDKVVHEMASELLRQLQQPYESEDTPMREKGATEFDKLCHKVFDANWKNYRARETGVKCRCGHELEAYYCEERLYLVECDQCETKALVKARSPKEAAYKTFAHEVIPVDDMGEDCAVFFSHTPIDEPPVYVGSTIDCDFPEDVVCGMYLPCPGTDGSELELEE